MGTMRQNSYSCKKIMTNGKICRQRKIPENVLPVRFLAKAMKADPNGGDTFRKKFTEEFAKDFKSKPESDRTMGAMYFFDPKIVKELAKQKDEFVEKLTLKKSDSISFKDAGSLLSFELAKQFTKKNLGNRTTNCERIYS